MLKAPHTSYSRLYVYYLDRTDLPPCEDPDLIGIWIEDRHAILFFHRPKHELVKQICDLCGAGLLYQADLDYHDWEAGVNISSFATRRLTVRPEWEPSGAGDRSQEIVLDPSVIFGSGFHPTTRMCLETMEDLFQEPDRRINTVADLGTGTGLLSVAAALFGAGKIMAVDNNPMAVAVAEKNIRRNNCTALVSARQLDLLSSLPDLTGCDLVIANLYKGLLARLFQQSAFWQAGLYMISGIIPSMEADLLALLPPRGLRMVCRLKQDMWRLWLLERTGEDIL